MNRPQPVDAKDAEKQDTAASPKVLMVRGDYGMDKGTVSNTTIIASGTIHISGGASLVLCAVSGRNVQVKGGETDKCLFYSDGTTMLDAGKHNSQFFGADSIVIGEKAAFGPLTVLMLRREGEKDSLSTIVLRQRSLFAGVMICSSDSIARMRSRIPSIVFKKGCALHGSCFTDGDIDLQNASIQGHVWARSIVTSDEKMAYTNFLFNVSLREPPYDAAFPLIGGTPVRVLIVAISLGLFVATLIFTGYTGLFKGFRSQAQRAENIRAMVMARMAVDKATKNSEALVLHGPEKIVFIRRGSRAEHTLEFRDSSIIYDNRVIAEEVRSMEFDVSEKKSAHGFLLVCWEALLKRNAWVGGVIIMRDGKQ